MILLWGLPADGPLAAVRGALDRRGVLVAFADQRLVLDSSVELEVGAAVGGWLQVGEQRVDLGSVDAAYLRPYDSRQHPGVRRAGPESPAWSHAVGLDQALWAWAEVTDALVVNPPAAAAASGSKPLQSALLRRHGFRVPETLVTTDPQAARAFWERHGRVVYKSISSIRSIVAQLTADHARRLEDVTCCPTQFQQYVAGVDHRVHVVGDELFCATVVSAADDYRYAGRSGASAEVRAAALEADCADRCRRVAAALGLPVAGIDLRRTPAGEWYCFEVNASPAFTWYDRPPGQRVAPAIARLLCDAGAAGRSGAGGPAVRRRG
jgi:hypothetical protein